MAISFVVGSSAAKSVSAGCYFKFKPEAGRASVQFIKAEVSNVPVYRRFSIKYLVLCGLERKYILEW